MLRVRNELSFKFVGAKSAFVEICVCICTHCTHKNQVSGYFQTFDRINVYLCSDLLTLVLKKNFVLQIKTNLKILNNYFRLYVCRSFHTYVRRSHFSSAPISGIISQNYNNKSWFVCVKSEKSGSPSDPWAGV